MASPQVRVITPRIGCHVKQERLTKTRVHQYEIYASVINNTQELEDKTYTHVCRCTRGGDLRLRVLTNPRSVRNMTHTCVICADIAV